MGTVRIERAMKAAAREHRKLAHSVDPLFVDRWSPRAMSGEAVPRARLMTLFEAARWAPSSYNGQPWRFLYAFRDSRYWKRFLALLSDFNRSWADQAGVLVVVVSRKTFEWNGEPARTHSFDAGAAWENLALQASLLDLVAHGMQGFDYQRARRDLRVPDDYDVEAMIAIGLPGTVESLPEALRERETPSDRRPLEQIALEGGFEKAP